jgi:hypothetical protein
MIICRCGRCEDYRSIVANIGRAAQEMRLVLNGPVSGLPRLYDLLDYIGEELDEAERI